MITRIIFSTLFLLFMIKGHAQQQNVPLSNFLLWKIDREIIQNDYNVHTAIKPYNLSSEDVRKAVSVYDDTLKHYYTVTQKMYKENMLIVEADDYKVTIDPLWNFKFGRDFHDTVETTYYFNTRGVRVTADIGDNVSFASSFYENQALFPKYYEKVVDRMGVVPQFGRAKDFNGDAFDFAFSSGYVSYSPTKWINLQFGQDKHFIGDGYRSLFLSDIAPNSPFLSFQLSPIKNITYKSIYSNLQQAERLPIFNTPEALYIRKTGVFHYLSLNVSPKISVGVFEGSILNRYNDSAGFEPFDYKYLNPVIGLNSLIYAGSKENNTLLGFNGKINLLHKFSLYGQIVFQMLDKLEKGVQLGIKSYDLFNIKNLFMTVEYNQTDENLYAFYDARQSYTHLRTPLAYLNGNDQNEIIFLFNYQYRRWFTGGQINYLSGNKIEGSVSSLTSPNIYNMVYNKEKVSRQFYDVWVAYFLNPTTASQFRLGYTYRTSKTENIGIENTSYIYLSFRSSLFNTYFDL